MEHRLIIFMLALILGADLQTHRRIWLAKWHTLNTLTTRAFLKRRSAGQKRCCKRELPLMQLKTDRKLLLYVPPHSTLVPFCSFCSPQLTHFSSGHQHSQAVIPTGSRYFTTQSVYCRYGASAPNKNADCFGFQTPYVFHLEEYQHFFFQLILFIACFFYFILCSLWKR